MNKVYTVRFSLVDGRCCYWKVKSRGPKSAIKKIPENIYYRGVKYLIKPVFGVYNSHNNLIRVFNYEGR